MRSNIISSSEKEFCIFVFNAISWTLMHSTVTIRNQNLCPPCEFAHVGICWKVAFACEFSWQGFAATKLCFATSVAALKDCRHAGSLTVASALKID
jgi:hypothetical protein